MFIKSINVSIIFNIVHSHVPAVFLRRPGYRHLRRHLLPNPKTVFCQEPDSSTLYGYGKKQIVLCSLTALFDFGSSNVLISGPNSLSQSNPYDD